ncbi:MAG: ABC transporter permease [Oscillospiraceae bacterium]|nr:ABC transporter permease [Oscillospiraceae bacterium]
MDIKKKINIIIAVIDVIVAVIVGSVLIYCSGQAKSVSLQGAAEKWAGDITDFGYTAVSVYTDNSTAFDIGRIYSMRTNIQQKLDEQIAAGNKGSLFADCWYGKQYITLTSSRTSLSAEAYAVGGSFFTVHEPEIISGSVFSPDDVNMDTVVIDENTSWKLFGSVDTAGLTVTAGDIPLYISAVIRSPHEGERLNAYKADGSVPTIYIPSQTAGVITGSEPKFTGYDILIPDKIDGFGSDIVKEAAGYSEGSSYMTVTDSRSRFGIKAINKQAEKLTGLAGSESVIVYPWWEDAARGVILKLSVCMKLCSFSVVVLLISAVYWIVMLCWLAAFGARKASDKVNAVIERKKLIDYYIKHDKHELAESVRNKRS